MSYKVRQGETITDAVLNSCGDIAAYSDFLVLNGFDTWTPRLYAGQVLLVPTAIQNLNNIRALNIYPANNASVPDVYEQIDNLLVVITDDWILRTGFWNDAEHWNDGKFWID